MRPAYDLTDPDDAWRYLEEETGRVVPSGREPHMAGRLASIADRIRWPRAQQPDGDEALAALTLVAALRDWLADAEPRLIDAARAQGVTWEQLAGVLRVGDRRAAQRRAARLAGAAARRRIAALPPDRREPPALHRYDGLLTRQGAAPDSGGIGEPL